MTSSAAAEAPPRLEVHPTLWTGTGDRDMARWSEAELIAQVLEGPEPAVQVLHWGEQLARLPFWERRALGVAGLVAEHGIPERHAVRLAALWELADRWFPDDRPAVTSPEQALVLLSSLAEESVERAVVLLLDGRFRLLRAETVAVGGANVVGMQMRDVLAPALRAGAAAMVLAHNHPSGDPRPSAADRRMTAALRDVAEVMGVPLLDHLVVSRRRHHSFRRSERWNAGPGWDADDAAGY